MLEALYTLHSPITLLHDHADERRDDLDALVASGDCFVTLATQLDAVVHSPASDASEHPELEDSIRTLLYLQRHYHISKKQPDYRQ